MKYGVCWCDPNRYDPVAEMIKVFDRYEEAASYYIHMVKTESVNLNISKQLWVAFIEDGHIVQLDRLERMSKTKILPFQMAQNMK